MVRPQLRKTHTYKNKILGSGEGTEGGNIIVLSRRQNYVILVLGKPFNLVKAQFSHL